MSTLSRLIAVLIINLDYLEEILDIDTLTFLHNKAENCSQK